jgi:phosphate/sulfate permease
MGTDVTELFVVITVVAVALIFDYTNGFHDSANAMAGPIATGALRPRTAVILAALLNLVGACLATEVAKTISGGFFDETLITVPIILAGLVGAIIWNLTTWLLGLPSSSSHALFGGLIGAVIVGAGRRATRRRHRRCHGHSAGLWHHEEDAKHTHQLRLQVRPGVYGFLGGASPRDL